MSDESEATDEIPLSPSEDDDDNENLASSLEGVSLREELEDAANTEQDEQFPPVDPLLDSFGLPKEEPRKASPVADPASLSSSLPAPAPLPDFFSDTGSSAPAHIFDLSMPTVPSAATLVTSTGEAPFAIDPLLTPPPEQYIPRTIDTGNYSAPIYNPYASSEAYAQPMPSDYFSPQSTTLDLTGDGGTYDANYDNRHSHEHGQHHYYQQHHDHGHGHSHEHGGHGHSHDHGGHDHGGHGHDQHHDCENQHGPGSGASWGWFSKTSFLGSVMERAKSSVETVITAMDPQMKEYIHSGGDIDIVVTSGTEVKVSAVRQAFQDVFGRATVRGIGTQPNVAPQPVGFSSGLEGAQQRIQILRRNSAIGEHQAAVSVENFIVELMPDRWFDMGCLLLQDPANQIELQAFTQAVPVPNEYVLKAKDETPSTYPLSWSGFLVTVGEIIHRNQPYINPSDWHEHFTGVSRKDMILLAAKSLAGMYKIRLQSRSF